MPKVISVQTRGNFKKTDRFLSGLVQKHYRRKLDHYGYLGVQALREATPRDSGKTAESWEYEIVEEGERLAIYWKNSNINNGVNIAIILQYGHGTRTGGFVEGVDYINPALRPIFDRMANEVWKEVIG